MTGMKHDTGKSDPTLVLESLAEAITLVTRVRDYGFRKYNSRDGWKQVDNGMQRYTAAQLRHMMATLQGREFDEESGLLELAHEACNVLFRLQFKIEELIEAADKMAPGGGNVMWQELQKFNDPLAAKKEPSITGKRADLILIDEIAGAAAPLHPTCNQYDEEYWRPLLSDQGSGKPDISKNDA